MNIFRKLRDWCVGHGGWLADSNRDAQYSAVDVELDRIEATRRGLEAMHWAEKAATQDINRDPRGIHIIHGDLGYNYWYTKPNGFLTAGTHYRTEGEAWRAALAEQEQEAAAAFKYDAADDDYAN